MRPRDPGSVRSARARPSGLAAACALVALVLGAHLGGRAAAGPTDIVKVDDFIDAPRAVFGRTREQIERTLGPPLTTRARPVRHPDDPRTDETLHELTYPGMVVRVLESAGLLRVRLTARRYALPYGLNVGTPRGRVEDVLGEAQALSDRRAMYLYSDGFPRTVEFYFRDNHVDRIEWNYRATD
jgi:hypothetical protein